MKRFFLFAATIPCFFMFSCNSQPAESTTESDEIRIVEPVRSCYIAAFKQDTIKLSIEDSGSSHIIGNLEYLPYEKDARIGLLMQGKMHGDTLFAIYQSEQEGQQSDCEIAMIKTKDAFVITRDIWTDGNYQYDSTYTHGRFKDKTHIHFEGGDTLRKSNCW